MYSTVKKIFLGTDHAGFTLKEIVKEKLMESGYDVEDKGSFSFDGEDDYPDFIHPVAEAVSKDPSSRGIIFGGSGQGEAICANRTQGIRSAVYYGGPIEIIKLSRQHNDANILSIGARFVTEKEAFEVISLWLQTVFEGGRHERRVRKIEK